MANVRITDLPALVGDFDIADLIEAVDVSDTAISATGTSKKATLDQLTQFVNSRLKKSVRVASEVAVTKNSLLVAGGVIQGKTLAENNRVLLGKQLDPGENGIWVVQAAGPPVRPVDFRAGLSVSMALVPVEEGQWAGYVWICTATSGSDIVDTNALPFQLVNSQAPPFDDALDLVFSHGRATTMLRVSLAALTTSAVRVLSMPDRNVDLGTLAVAHTLGQFAASEIHNDSGVSGTTVRDALNSLELLIGEAGSGAGRDGLKLSTPSTAAIQIGAGSAALPSGDVLTLASTIVKNLTGTWVAGTGRGLDTGVRASDTWYYVWLILNPGTVVTDVLLSASAASPTLPSGYTVGMRLGAFLTDGSGNILPFEQWHDWMFWDSPVDTVFTSTSGLASLQTLTVPPSGIVEARINGIVGGDINGSVVVSAPAAANAGPSSSLATWKSGQTGEINVCTDASARVRVRANIAGVVVHLRTLGWRDGPLVWFH